MANEHKGMAWPTDTPARRNARYCPNCWWRTKDAGELFCSHCTPAYERGLAKGQTEEEQDTERAALRNLGASVTVPEDYFHDAFDCPDPTGDHCENARRYALVRAGVRIPGLRPKNELGEM